MMACSRISRERQSVILITFFCWSLHFTTYAFSPRRQRPLQLGPNSNLFKGQKTLFPRVTLSPRFATGSDDDEDHLDDDDDPLSKGVNSVSWLPSVQDAKRQEIGSARDVSDAWIQVDLMFCFFFKYYVSKSFMK